jgi:hypothetical protein
VVETNGDRETTKQPSGSEVVSTRVNVAFPFSAIRVEAPSEEIVALAALVRDLTRVVAEATPGDKAQELVKRADEVLTRLK